jgi:hypothetical protein
VEAENMTRSLKLSYSLARALPLIALVTFSISAAAVPVQLENATATFSQGGLDGVGPYSPAQAIDGITSGPYGWTIDHFPNNDPTQEYTTNETAVWQTVPDVGPSLLTFTMYFEVVNPHHLLGRFRLSVTTDDRSTYADGLASGGNVTANWTVLQDLVVQGPSGMTFTDLPDDSVLAGGIVPGQGVYDVSGVADLSGITGIRLEALTDPSLPHGGGPGFAANGNFVLTEIQLDAAAIPEPSTWALLFSSLGLLGFVARRKNKLQVALPSLRG